MHNHKKLLLVIRHKWIDNVKKNANSLPSAVYTVPGISNDSCTYTLAYDGTSDNNLRYVGANPCNYVKIDNEICRIIGVMNNIDDGKVVVSEQVTYTGNENLQVVNDSNKVNSMLCVNVGHADKTLNKVHFHTLDLESSNSDEFWTKDTYVVGDGSLW